LQSRDRDVIFLEILRRAQRDGITLRILCVAKVYREPVIDEITGRQADADTGSVGNRIFCDSSIEFYPVRYPAPETEK
jgi:hypothetical protein